MIRFGLLLFLIITVFGYYTYTQHKLKELQLLKVQHQQQLIQQHKVTTITKEVTTSFNEINTFANKNNNKVLKHDIGELALKHPLMIQRRINNGTKELFKNFEEVFKE